MSQNHSIDLLVLLLILYFLDLFLHKLIKNIQFANRFLAKFTVTVVCWNGLVKIHSNVVTRKYNMFTKYHILPHFTAQLVRDKGFSSQDHTPR